MNNDSYKYIYGMLTYSLIKLLDVSLFILPVALRIQTSSVEVLDAKHKSLCHVSMSR